VFHEFARRRESKIEEGHLMLDHVHMLICIPPKYSVAEVINFMKGKSSIWIAQNVERKARNLTGHKFWARGYFVSTVGRDEEMISLTQLAKRYRNNIRSGKGRLQYTGLG
jgi:putative transposase